MAMPMATTGIITETKTRGRPLRGGRSKPTEAAALLADQLVELGRFEALGTRSVRGHAILIGGSP